MIGLNRKNRYGLVLASLVILTGCQPPLPQISPTVISIPILPSETVTPMPPPTITPTPQPTWITSFAQPILDKIATLPPDFEDNFDQGSRAWQLFEWCGGWRMQFTDGEMLLTECTAYVGRVYDDFVGEVDTHFTDEDKAEDIPSLGVVFRMQGNSGYTYAINYDGHAYCSYTGGSPLFEGQHPAYAGTQINRLLVIAKGPEIALYLNEDPLAYFTNSTFSWGNVGVYTGTGSQFPKAVAGFDNYRIWDISDISIP